MTQPKLRYWSDIADFLEHALQENKRLERQLKEAVNDRITLHVQYAEAHADLSKRQSEFEAREKLTKDEFERRLQDIQVEFRKERHQLERLVRTMKADLGSCICKGDALARVSKPLPVRTSEETSDEDHELASNRHDAARARREAWMLRNGK